MIKALIFDYNGVLVLDLDIHIDAYLKLFDEKEYHVSREILRENQWMTQEDKMKTILGKDFTEELFIKLIEEKRKIYREILHDYKFIPDNLEKTLGALAKKFRLAISSSTFIGDMGFAFSDYMHFFDPILTDKDIEKHKPDPSLLLKTAKILNVKPEECAYIGDAPTDMEAAKNAGMMGIGITTGFDSKEDIKKAGADKVFDNLNEFCDYILK